MNQYIYVHNQTCIQRPLKWTWKCDIYKQLSSIYRLQLYALFINGRNEVLLYIIWRGNIKIAINYFDLIRSLNSDGQQFDQYQ